MSTALVSAFYDVGDMLYKNASITRPTQLRGDKRAVGTPINGISRRHSTSSSSNNPLSGTANNSIHALNRSNSYSVSGSTTTSISVFHSETFITNKEGKMRERALSDSDRNNQRNQNSSRYKTELCRPFEESGACKYGDKCQFAHGIHELRTLSRHPKYKTELCRTFHTVGFCPYGPRCHFIHKERELASASSGPSNNNMNLNKRDRPERPKLLPMPSAPAGLSTGGDLTPPHSLCDSPNPLTPPPNFFSEEAQEFLASLAAASALSGINSAFIGQDMTPLLSPGPLSPTFSGLQSPFLGPMTNLQLNDLDPFNGQDNVFFSPEDVIPNVNGINGYRPPSPPDSLSDPESLADSLGPASPLPAISLPSLSTRHVQPPPMQSPVKPQPPQQQLQQQLSPGGRLPIFRGISMEDRFY